VPSPKRRNDYNEDRDVEEQERTREVHAPTPSASISESPVEITHVADGLHPRSLRCSSPRSLRCWHTHRSRRGVAAGDCGEPETVGAGLKVFMANSRHSLETDTEWLAFVFATLPTIAVLADDCQIASSSDPISLQECPLVGARMTEPRPAARSPI
jgi:hypothetical protein